MTEHFIKFNIPEDKDDLTLAINGINLWSVLWDLDQFMRNCQKYEHKFASADDAIEKLRKYLHESMDGNNISFDMVD